MAKEYYKLHNQDFHQLNSASLDIQEVLKSRPTRQEKDADRLYE